MQNLVDILKGNPYPGRGIVVGKDRAYYFIMGRSENSRNRVFVKTEDGIRTEAHDPAKLVDPSLIIYHPVRAMGEKLVSPTVIRPTPSSTQAISAWAA